jgi:D-arginine dehydrogenase
VADFVIVGGGIAGVSAAAFLAPHGSVVLLEKEQHLAYHTTGRSAALFVVNYGESTMKALSKASLPFFDDPPENSTDSRLLTDRGGLWIANADQLQHLDELEFEGQRSGAGSQRLDSQEVIDLVPVLRPDAVAAGLYEPSGRDIDVSGLHQAFVRIARRHGAEIRTDSEVISIGRRRNAWEIVTSGGTMEGAHLINAAGAWGDHVGLMAGLRPLGLQPMRRTAFMVPGSDSFSAWPLTADAQSRFYFKPDGQQLLCSLAEEVPSEPTDARPRMEDIALAIDRINQATTLEIRTVNSQWTGLRTFAPDRQIVIGPDPQVPSFLWLVGLGGTGIAAAPASGDVLARLAIGVGVSSEQEAAGVDLEQMSPRRFSPA